MKAELIIKRLGAGHPSKGSGLIEILIAVAVLTLSIGAVIMLVFVNQNLRIDTETNNEAVFNAKKIIETARADADENFSSVVSSSPVSPPGYSSHLAITDNGLCEKWAVVSTTWSVSPLRQLHIDITTDLVDAELALALGGDCGGSPPGTPPPAGGGPTWEKPDLFASYKFPPPASGQPTAIDVLNGIVYMPDDHKQLNIVDTSGAALHFSGTFISLPFDVGVNLNDIDVALSTSTGRRYVYTARDDRAKQFEIIDVTNIASPVVASTTSLKNVNDSMGQGWKVAYYDGYAYVVTRYTSGDPEFHIFNVASSTAPIEVGNGTVLNTSLYGIVVRDQNIGGTKYRFAYLVTTHNSKEIIVLDVTNPADIKPVTQAYTNIPLNKDGRSIFLVNNRLYIGLESGGGPDFYVLDASDPIAAVLGIGLPILGNIEIGADVNSIRVTGKFAFMATSKASDEFQVWNISDQLPCKLNPSGPLDSAKCRIKTDPYNVPNKISSGIDFENPYIYAASQANDQLQILYSAP